MNAERACLPRVLNLALVALALLPSTAPVWGQQLATIPCEQRLPEVLEIGVPFRVFDAALTPEDIQDQAREALEPQLWPETGEDGGDPCAGERQVQINLSIGTDYEILDWLSQEEVDGALVSALGLWLLTTDGADLVDVTPPGSATGALHFQARYAVGRPGGSDSPEEAPEGALEGYRRQLLCRALAAVPDAAEAVPELARGCPPPEELEENGRETGQEEDTELDPICRPGPAFGLRYRPVLPDHFSATGFVLPMSSQSLWFDQKIEEARRRTAGRDHERLFGQVRSAYWQAWFCDARFTLDHAPYERLQPPPGSAASRPLDLQGGPEPKDVVEILFGDLPWDLYGTSELQPPPEAVAGDRWVLHGSRRGAAQSTGTWKAGSDRASQISLLPESFYGIFAAGDGEAPEPRWSLPGAKGSELPPLPLSFASFLQINSRFGVRTMAFTIDETLRLLRAQERAHEREPNLSLVLPGGGVKSVYQAVLLDRLYASGSLRNELTAGAVAPVQDPLAVHSVIGTSGGALTGYFVAQLGDQGPFNLTQILWNQGNGAEDPCDPEAEAGAPLTSEKIFSFTDLARYMSLIVSFLIFCGGLTWLALRQRRAVPTRYGKISARYRLRLCLAAILAATPVLVQLTSVARYREHVPEIEGVLYMVMVLLVMMADQCVVDTDDGRGQKSTISWQLPLAAGALIIAVPVLGRFALYLQQKLSGTVLSQTAEDLAEVLLGGRSTVGLTYFLISLLVVFGGLILPLRTGRRNPWLPARLKPFTIIGEYLLFSALALLLLFIPGVRDIGGRVELVLWALGLPGLFWLMFRYLGPKKEDRTRWWLLYYGGLWLSCFLTLLICQPGEDAESGLRGFLVEPTGLDVSGASLMVVTGALIVTVGVILWICNDRSCYRFQNLKRFMAGLIVAMGHAIAVFATVGILAWLFPATFTTLELDRRYWLLTLPLALLFALLILRIATRLSRGPASGFVVEGVTFLTESHPNRPFVSVRFVRMVVVAVLAVAWWNFLLAPALYGNKLARNTLYAAIQRFETQWTCAHEGRVSTEDGDEVGQLPPFTAPFVSPANELAEDGTRFFLFAPSGEADCPEVPERARSGSRWLPYEVVDRKTSLSSLARGSRCTPLFERDLLQEVIFASGSPFPIFAPHRVKAQIGDRDEMILIDGGYTNNVPVEAAQTLQARQALILRSEHPSPVKQPPSAVGKFFSRLVSPLVRNLGRLPGFLFQRSQQVDRLSSQDLFVVSLAPLADHQDWPELYHFQGAVIQRLKGIAEADLGRRIGFVESWGRPEPRLSLRIEEPEAAEEAVEPDEALEQLVPLDSKAIIERAARRALQLQK